MPLPRFHKLPTERRRAILDAAAAEFAARGFEGASFNRIIASAGISKGAMYYYFADKADAYGAVLDDALDKFAQTVGDIPGLTGRHGDREPGAEPGAMAGVPPGVPNGGVPPGVPNDPESFWNMLAAALARLGETLFADAQLAALARGLYRSGRGPVYQRLLSRSAAWVESILALGQDVGAIRDDLPRDLLAQAVTGLLVAIDRWFADAMAERPFAELAPLMPRVLDLVRDCLAPERKAS